MGNGDVMANGPTDRLLGKLNERTESMARDISEIKTCLRNSTDSHNTRIKVLEIDSAQRKGGVRMLSALMAASATIGGVVGTFVSKIWPT